MTKIKILCLLVYFIICSCKKEGYVDNYPADVIFGITARLFKDKKIDCIKTDRKGNIYVGSDKELFVVKGANQESYSIGSPVLDIAVGRDNIIWIGTSGKGLGRFDGKKIIWYNKDNSGLPRNYVAQVETDNDNRIWFSSCAYKIGGLGIFDGHKFDFLTPENSPLNQNIISDMEVGPDGAVYIATSGKVNLTNIYRIKDKSWQCLGDENGTFYWIFTFTVTPSGKIFLVEDFSLSSLFEENRLFCFDNNEWHEINEKNQPKIPYMAVIKSDKRNYLWLAGYEKNSAVLYVYNGKSWIRSPEGLLPDDIITVIETDYENNIYLGTYRNGIFILKQN